MNKKKEKKIDEFFARMSSKEETPNINWAKKRDEWLKCLKEFYDRVNSYLKKYVSEGRIRIASGRKRISEDYIGEYEVSMVTIHIGNSQIRLEPIGTNLIGAKGRVDMVGPNGKVKFVLVDKEASAPRVSVQIVEQYKEASLETPKTQKMEWDWKISTPPPAIKYIELNPESFFDAFMEIANA